MINLIRIEYKKLLKTTYFLASFLSIVLSPIISLLIMSINPDGFVLGDFNKINIILLSMIGARMLFPIIAMSLIQVGNGMAGIRSSFLMPINRTKLIFAKVLVAYLWMCLLIIVSVGLTTLLEFILFRDINIIPVVIKSLRAYFIITLYAFPIQIFAMVLALVMRNVFIPNLILMGSLFTGYGIQLNYEIKYLPSVIPSYIAMENSPVESVWFAFVLIWIIGICSIITLRYLILHKDYID